MRGVRIASTVAVSALLVGALAACGSSAKKSADAVPGGAGTVAPAGGGGLGPKGELLAAAAVMQKAGSSKINVSSDDQSSPAGDGVYTWQAKPAIDLAMKDASSGPSKLRVVDGSTYLGVGDVQAATLGGKHWFKVDGSGPLASMNASFQTMIVMLDPAVQLTAAAQNGKLSKIGSETVDGTSTQHYQSVMPVDALVAAVPNLKDSDRKAVLDVLKQDGSTVTTDFWLNGQHQLVQEKEVGSDAASASPSATKSSATTTKYSDFGVKADVTAPAASDLADPTAAMKVLGGN